MRLLSVLGPGRSSDNDGHRRLSRSPLRSLALAMATALVVVGFTLSGGGAANAAAGDYTVELQGPSSVPIYDQFTYTATINAEVTAGAPASGIVLTSILAEGLEFNSVPTGADSPVQSYSYDAASRTVSFTLKPLADQLSSFVYSVSQVANTTKDASTVYDTSLSGSTTPSGAVPADDAQTTVSGDNRYVPRKSFTTLIGSGNRLVTYYFNVATSTPNGETFTAWSQTLTDTLPAGAVVTGTSTWGGAWVTTANGDGSTTAVWNRAGAYGPTEGPLDENTNRIWITVSYPQADFPDGTLPPVNQVDLDITDRSGNSYGPTSAQVQGLPFSAGATKAIYVQKDANTLGNDAADVGHGTWIPAYVVKASYLNQLDADRLDDLIVEDSSAHSPENAEFFAHADIYRLLTTFNPVLAAEALPYTLEYTTTGSAAWKAYTGSTLTTASELRLIVQTAGSVGFNGRNGYSAILNLPAGERLNGWRVVLSPDASTSIPSGAELRVQPGYIASYPSLDTGLAPTAPFVNTATASGTTVAGEQYDGTDAATITVLDRVPILTHVQSPNTLNVGDAATFRVVISNLEPSGRSYSDSVMKVVLPVGVVYDTADVIAREFPRTPASDIAVPQPGSGLTITTETITDSDGEHQVVVFTFDELESLRTSGQTKSGNDLSGFTYLIPTTVLPQAFDASNAETRVSSWAYTDDSAYTGVPMGYFPTYYGTDEYDFSSSLSTIAVFNARPVVTTAGGLLIGKQVRQDSTEAWRLDATVASPGTAQWQIYVANVLPQVVTNIVVFDRLPYVGDNRLSEFPVTLSGALGGLPVGASAEYSVDATSATTGSWTSTAAGATAFRVVIPSLSNGQSVSLIAPTDVPTGLDYDQSAVNNLSATADYQGSNRAFQSNDATIQAEGDPSFTLVKTTNGVEYSAAPGARVAVGSDVTWAYEITNTGNTALDDLQIDDSFTDGAGSSGTLTPVTSATGPLAPGQSRTFIADGVAVDGQYENTATASATAVDAQGTPITPQPADETDESWYLAGTAGLTIVKTTDDQDVSSAPGLALSPGDEVEWGYTVTNTGTLTLVDVLVEDVSGDGTTVFSETISSMAPGASVELTASGVAITGQYRNTVTATADDPAGTGLSLVAADNSWYFGVESALAIVKQVSADETGPWTETTEVDPGDASYWRITVTNAGNSPLTGVVLTDPELDETVELGTLGAGEHETVIFIHNDTTTGFTNVAFAVGTDPQNSQLSADDDAAVTVTEAAVPPLPGDPQLPGPVSPDGQLAATGLAIAGSIGVALMLLLAGVILVARRRRSTEDVIKA